MRSSVTGEMSDMTTSFGGSRSTFLPGEGYGDTNIKYQRYGGCFVSTKRAVFYVVASIIAVVTSGTLVYYYAPCRTSGTTADPDIFDALTKLTNEQAASAKARETRALPRDVVPAYYRVKIQPFLDGDRPPHYKGKVFIVFQAREAANEVAINCQNINVSDVSMSRSSAMTFESQVAEEHPNAVDAQGNEGNNTESTVGAPTTDVVLNDTSAPNETVSETTPSSSIEPSSSSSSSSSVSSTTPSTTTTTTTVLPETPVLKTATKIDVPIESHHYNDTETYVIKLRSDIEKNINYTLEIEFEGDLSENNGGLLKTRYKDDSNKSNWMAITILKPSYARTAFPCFDDPMFKSRFEISVARRTNMFTLSNMVKKETESLENQEGWVWDHFQISPPMPTYLVAFAVLNYDSKKLPSTDSSPVLNMWTRLDHSSSYISTIIPKLCSFYNSFLQSYSLPKIDIVMIPDLRKRMVENKAVVYLKEDMLSIRHDSSQMLRNEAANIVANQLAHQWFSNLITKWNDTWLIEGLALYMQYVGICSIEPHWGTREEFAFQTLQDVLDTDYTMTLKKMIDFQMDTSVTELMSNYFVFKKSFSIIRMLNNSVTEELFLKGLRMYIEEGKEENVDQSILWNNITLSSKNAKLIPENVDIFDFITTWTQDGYPLITVTAEDDNSIIVKQKPYPHSSDTSPSNWITPLTYATNASQIENPARVWLTENSTKLSASLPKGSWIIFNIHQTTPCRVNYDARNWAALLKLLAESPETLPEMNRAHLLDDAFHLARNSLLDYKVPLNMTRYLVNSEKSYLPWQTALKNLRYLSLVFSKTASYGSFQEYMLKLITPIYRDLGVMKKGDDEPMATQKLRNLVFEWACKLNYNQCIKYAYDQFQIWTNMTDPDAVNPLDEGLRPTIYCVGVQMERRRAWDFLWQRFLKAKHDQEKSKALIYGLGCSNDAWILYRYLQKSLNYNETLLQNSIMMWEALSTDYATTIAFDFLRSNWDTLKTEYFFIKTIINGPLSKLSTKNELDELKRFFSEHLPELKRFTKDILVTIKRIKRRIEWKDDFLTYINEWLTNNVEN